MKVLYYLLLTTSLSLNGLAQSTFFLSGYVRDAAGQPLSGSSLLVLDTGYGTITDSLGYYRLPIPKGLQTIQFSHQGFETQQPSLTIRANTTLSVSLVERISLLREATVTGNQPGQAVSSNTVGLTTLSVRALRTLPVLLGELDVMRSVQLLPGVSSVGEASSGFNVRGGSADQNLMLLDEVPLFNAQHLLGFLSVFNPDVVQDMSFYRGTAPAGYGGRTASVLQVRLRDANATKPELVIGLGLLSSRLKLEAPLIRQKLTVYIAGRLSTVNPLLALFPVRALTGVRGGFHDLTARIDYRPNARNKISLTAFSSADRFTLPGDSLRQVELSGSSSTFSWQTRSLTLHWSHYLSARWQAQSSIVWSRYRAMVSTPDSASAYRLTSGIDYTHVKTNFTYTPNDHWHTDMGIIGIRYGVTAGQLDALGASSQINPVSLPNEQALESALYTHTDLTLSKQWSMQAGLRVSGMARLGPDITYRYRPGQTPSSETLLDSVETSSGRFSTTFGNVEPRLSVRWAPGERYSFKLGIGRMVQYLQLLSNTTASLPADRWKIADTHLRLQIADQVSLGYFHYLPKAAVEVSIEGFYKRLTGVNDFRGNVPLLLNPYPETAVLQGNGFARGLEVFIRRSSGLLTGWLSYTFSQTRYLIAGASPSETVNNGQYYPAGHDRPHVLNAVLNYKLNSRVSLSLNGIYNSGRPVTYPVAKIYVGNRIVPYYTDRNQSRLPDYLRADISLTISNPRGSGRRFESDWNFSLYNMLGRRNAYSIYVQTTPRYADYYNIVTAYKFSVLGAVIPSISYTIRL
ncbi:TonB-dependent receptor [Spirosoma linguale]|uniref:TonB-dependent receptor plug n=1 Tax=Spirosoma linguale (strain ATCC 33905 / DSM 74 / LMG 10896 / Claus 1) TaxID=504472 RepID=D2QKA1_SPILD|nr:TonB-dependent receptor plug [Spirosoma linguale DSM 74]